MDIVPDLVSLSKEVWRRLSERLEKLTDEEYLWEPASGCWTVRRADGGHRADWGYVFETDPPFTTIAWRMWHLVHVLGAERNARWLGLEPEPLDRTNPPPTADGALQRVRQAYALWLGCLDRTSTEALAEKLGPQAGQYAEETRLAFVLHQIDEFVHHAAEVAVLRDLYRATRPMDPLVEACLNGSREAFEAARTADPEAAGRLREEHPELLVDCAETGRWDGVRLLLDLGFATSRPSGTSALHHAAAAGNLEMARLLVDRGADVEATDPTWKQTPKGWAEFFRREDVVTYLAPLTKRPSDPVVS